MAGGRWAPEEDEWLSREYPTHCNAWLSENKPGTLRSENAITARAKVLGLAKDRAAGYKKPQPRKFWTEERVAWLRAFVPGHTEQEIVAAFAERFGVTLTRTQVKNAKQEYGVKSGTHGGQFPKGHVPANKGRPQAEWASPEARSRMAKGQFAKGIRPYNQGELLDERKDRDGYWQVKVDPRNAKNTMGYWIGKGQFVWMQANGRDWPEGHKCAFADHDKENFDPDNLVPVPSELWPVVMGAVKGQMEYHDRETLEAAIASARLTVAAEKLRRSLKMSRRSLYGQA